MNNTVIPNINNIDFTATYSAERVQSDRRFLILCLSNPVGWVVGGLYLINELFKSVILCCGRSVLFGRHEHQHLRNYQLLRKFTIDMGAKNLNLKTADGRTLEATYIKGLNQGLNQQQQKTVLVFTGSGRPYEFDGYAIADEYRKNGYNVFCMNYGGFGDSEGTPCQSSIELDAETAYQYIQSTTPASEIYTHGYSLGSYPATYLSNKVKKVVIDRGFSAISNVVRDTATLLFGRIIGYILQGLVKYVCPLDNIRNIESTANNILCIQAFRDQVMREYHVELIQQHAPQVTIHNFDGGHFHSPDSIWLQDNIEFWNWINKKI